MIKIPGRRSGSKATSKKAFIVMMKAQGGRTEKQMKGGKFKTEKEAVAFYNDHPRATLIRKIDKDGLSAGIIQPGVPKKIKRGKKEYIKAYVGPYKKTEAEKIVRDLKKEGNVEAIVVTKKKRHFVFWR